MLAFAGNSVLCRIALKHTTIDAASFTAIRLVSGALVLWVIVSLFRRNSPGGGNWLSALALFAYAASFSFAYVSLTAATGALLLFGAVQATMIGHGLWVGERLQKLQLLGLVLAFGGLTGLLLPGLAAPPLLGSVLMLIAGVAWGVYSLRGKSAGDPTRITAGNFLRAAVLAVLLAVLLGLWQNSGSYFDSYFDGHSGRHLDIVGVGYAIASGAVTSGLGYAIWYAVLLGLKAVSAATVQLSVPVIAALGGNFLLGEPLTARLVLASLAILGGIALVILNKSRQ
jgi:drug/metabolite transporter (DMT)-like permease